MIKLIYTNYSKEKIKKTCQCVQNIFLFLIIIASSQTAKAQFSNECTIAQNEAVERWKNIVDNRNNSDFFYIEYDWYENGPQLTSVLNIVGQFDGYYLSVSEKGESPVLIDKDDSGINIYRFGNYKDLVLVMDTLANKACTSEFELGFTFNDYPEVSLYIMNKDTPLSDHITMKDIMITEVKEEEVDPRTKEEIDADLAAYKKAAQAREAQEELDNYEAMKRNPAWIQAAQMLSIEELEDLIEYFGSDDSKVYEFRCFNDRETDALFMKSKYRKDKVYYQGEYYYNVYYEMQLKFKDVNSVYESGDKIYFNIGSEGYRQKAKPPGEDWSDYVKNFNDFTMTIYNDDKRKEALSHFKYLVEHPYNIDVDR
ncbi:MAG: hypothetical protein ACI9O4_000574 [Chitinophagales bacterium]|jgi:hypothetical protein